MATVQVKHEKASSFRNESALTLTLSLFVEYIRKCEKAPEWACEFASCKIMYETNAHGVGGWVLDLEQFAEELCMSTPMLRSALCDFVENLRETGADTILPDVVNSSLHAMIDRAIAPIPAELICGECVNILDLLDGEEDTEEKGDAPQERG